MLRSVVTFLYVRLPDAILGCLLILMVGAAVLQVIGRYVLPTPLPWTEEVARYLFVWLTFLGAAVGFRYGKHVVIDLLGDRLSPGLRRVQNVAIDVVALVVAYYLFRHGYELVDLGRMRRMVSVRMNMGFLFAAVPTGAALMALYAVEDLVRSLLGREKQVISDSRAMGIE